MSGQLPQEFDLPLEACPLCSFQTIQSYDRDYRGIAISRCRRCGVKFMNPQYSDAYLSAFYSHYLTPDRPFGAGPEYAAVESQRRVDNFATIEQCVPVGRLLAIGCGDGRELQVAQRRGWVVEGYDVDGATTAKLSEQMNIPIYTGELCQLGLPGETYDCVYLDQVLEHPKQPQKCLRKAHRLLRPGGAMFVGCPNIASMACAAKGLLERLGVRRACAAGITVPSTTCSTIRRLSCGGSSNSITASGCCGYAATPWSERRNTPTGSIPFCIVDCPGLTRRSSCWPSR